MPIAKMKWSRRLAVAFCTMLLLCTALPVTAFADDVHIATAWQPFMYFECNEPGYWIDLGTPPHSVVETGQAAYCLWTAPMATDITPQTAPNTTHPRS